METNDRPVFHSKAFLRSESGMTLVETMTASSMFMVVLSVLLSVILLVQDHVQFLIAIGTRDQIQKNIVRALMSPKTIQNTRMKDQVFNACFLTQGPQTLCPGNVTLPVSLYNEAGDQIAGTDSAPVYFTATGDKCTATSPANHCFIKVTATIRAQGVAPAFDTSQPMTSDAGFSQGFELIEVKYLITVIGGTSSHFASRSISGSIALDRYDREAFP